MKTGFKSKNKVVVSKDTTIEKYQNLMNEEAKRKRNHFRQAVELRANLDMIHQFKSGKQLEFSISLTDEKGAVIETIFATAKMPVGLEDSKCYADLLQNGKMETVRLSGDRFRTFTAVRLESAK